ncbi:MAG: helix-turn-helix transcriptional regulator [Patescibacteria group bacterium]
MKNYIDFDTYINRRLKDPKFRKNWEELEPEYQIAKSVMEARIQKGFTQQNLAKKAGTSQAVISRIERGVSVPSPSISTLRRIIEATGRKLELRTS